MQELKDRIVKEGKILPGNIVKVDGFSTTASTVRLWDASLMNSRNSLISTK